jgi:hypothetical protein
VEEVDNWVCDSCQIGQVRCFVCQEVCKKADQVLECTHASCRKTFHTGCLASFLKVSIAEVVKGVEEGNRFVFRRMLTYADVF